MKLLRTFKRPILLLVAVAVLSAWLKSLSLEPGALELLGSLLFCLLIILLIAIGIGRSIHRADELDEQAIREHLARQQQLNPLPAENQFPPTVPHAHYEDFSFGQTLHEQNAAELDHWWEYIEKGR